MSKPKNLTEDEAIEADFAGMDDALDEALKDREPSPLDSLVPTGDVEKDCAAELSATMKEFKAAARKTQEQITDNTDSEFWFAVYFQNREQKEAFLRALKLLPLGDKYLDGIKAAASLGVKLPEVRRTYIPEKTDANAVGVGLISRVPKALG